MKKIVTILLAITMLVASMSLVACGDESIKVKTEPTRVVYNVDETFSLDGLSVVKVKGDEETALTKDTDYTVDSSACDMTKAGEYEVKITSKENAEWTCSFKVTVKEFFDGEYASMSLEDADTFFAEVNKPANTYGTKFNLGDGYVYNETTTTTSTTVKKLKSKKNVDDGVIVAGTVTSGDSVTEYYFQDGVLYSKCGTDKDTLITSLDSAFDGQLAYYLQKSRDQYVGRYTTAKPSGLGFSASDIKYEKFERDGITRIKVTFPTYEDSGTTMNVTLSFAYDANYKLVGAKTILDMTGTTTQNINCELVPYAGDVVLPTDLNTYFGD